MKNHAALVVGLVAVLFILSLSLFTVDQRQAALVFTSIPFAMTGGVLALYLRGIPFSISAAHCS